MRCLPLQEINSKLVTLKTNFHFFFHSIGSDWFFAVTKGSSAGSDFNLLNDDFEFYIA